MTSNSRPVYSTQTGRLCPDCGKPVADCRCKPGTKSKSFSSLAGSFPQPKSHSSKAKPVTTGAPDDGYVRIHREKAGRGGKEVSVIKGLKLSEPELVILGKELKTRCGTGGTVKDGTIEIQGDHRERLKTLLEAKAHKVKLAGG